MNQVFLKAIGLILALGCSLSAMVSAAQQPAAPQVSTPPTKTFAPETAPVDLRPGPAVWKEEYWDVKPGKLDEFVAAYRREIYDIARKIPGYRGYTVLTLITSPADPPAPLREGADRMIQPHYSLWTNKKMLTERQINVGVLYRLTHNVIVIHHMQTWADADKFPAAFAAAYAKAHGGESSEAGLAKTVYPLASNTWETYFRTVATGFPAHFTGVRTGDDADGLNLEPHAEPIRWVKEFFLIDPPDLAAVMDADNRYSYAAIRLMAGDSGVTAITSLPPGKGDAQQTAYSKQHYPLGGADDFLVPEKGVLMDGVFPLETSVNFSSMFRKTFTLVTYEHQQSGAEMLMSSTLDAAYGKLHPGPTSTQLLQKYFFPLIRNHWDLRYRMIETSFAPGEAKIN